MIFACIPAKSLSYYKINGIETVHEIEIIDNIYSM